MTVLDHTLDAADVARVVQVCLAEDLGSNGDVTTAATVPAGTRMRARFTARAGGVVAGLPVVAAVLEAVGDASLVPLVADGDAVIPGQALAEVEGRAASVLAAERTALNLASHLSGIATVTRQWVDAVEGTGARIRDTRKTTPGLRLLDKYAVRCGGGTNHRVGLYDAVLIKDNHLTAAGGIRAALAAARVGAPGMAIQIEVDTVEQLTEALAAGASEILLDNMDLATLHAAVRTARASGRPVVLEASGGLTLERARALAMTGVDYLAVGALTHSAPSLDIGLDVVG